VNDRIKTNLKFHIIHKRKSRWQYFCTPDIHITQLGSIYKNFKQLSKLLCSVNMHRHMPGEVQGLLSTLHTYMLFAYEILPSSELARSVTYSSVTYVCIYVNNCNLSWDSSDARGMPWHPDHTCVYINCVLFMRILTWNIIYVPYGMHRYIYTYICVTQIHTHIYRSYVSIHAYICVYICIHSMPIWNIFMFDGFMYTYICMFICDVYVMWCEAIRMPWHIH